MYKNRGKNGYEMQQFHTINTAFSSCTENIRTHEEKKKKKESTWFNDIPDHVTHPLSVTFIKCQTWAESSAKHNMISIGSYRKQIIFP